MEYTQACDPYKRSMYPPNRSHDGVVDGENVGPNVSFALNFDSHHMRSRTFLSTTVGVKIAADTVRETAHRLA